MMKHHYLCGYVLLCVTIACCLSRVTAQEITKVKGDQFRIDNIKKTGLEVGMEFEIMDELSAPSGIGRLVKIKDSMGLGEVLEGSVDKGYSVRKFAKDKAVKPTIKKRKLYLDSFASGSYSSIQMDSADASPMLTQAGIGVSVGYWMKNWAWVGVTSDYRFINQYSTPSATSGNFRGTYWNYASFSLGKNLGSIKTKLDIHYFGKYRIENKTVSGKGVSYKSPLGLRIMGLYPMPFFKQKLHAGGVLEWIQLKKQTIGSTDYNSDKKLWQAGVVLGYVF